MTAREPLPLELLPCPFCGCAKIEWLGYLSNSLLRCTQCGCTSDDGSRERVITAWNRRPPSAREEADRVLRELLEAYDVFTFKQRDFIRFKEALDAARELTGIHPAIPVA
jgi:hypothetical protein